MRTGMGSPYEGGGLKRTIFSKVYSSHTSVSDKLFDFHEIRKVIGKQKKELFL